MNDGLGDIYLRNSQIMAEFTHSKNTIVENVSVITLSTEEMMENMSYIHAIAEGVIRNYVPLLGIYLYFVDKCICLYLLLAPCHKTDYYEDGWSVTGLWPHYLT